MCKNILLYVTFIFVSFVFYICQYKKSNNNCIIFIYKYNEEI